MENESLLLKLRDAARIEKDELIRFNLKLIADQLDEAIRDFTKVPTGDNLTAVNGYWSHGLRMLSFAGKRNGPGGAGGGLKEGAKLANVA